MAHYLVKAVPDQMMMSELYQKLQNDEFVHLKPFGKSLSYSLNNAKINEDGLAMWEEEDHCDPPLKEEREAVLDEYFRDIEVEEVDQREGWQKIAHLPPLFDEREQLMQ